MVMSNNKKLYSYGNVAYDFEPSIIKEEKKRKRQKVNNKKKTKVKLKLMTCIMVLSMLSFLSLCRFAAIIKITNNIHSIKKEIKQIQKNNEDLKVKMAKYNNIKNIETFAVSKYGMIVPDRQSVRYVDVKPFTVSVAEVQKTDKLTFIKRVLGLIY
ncbi:MAG: hypothetical protein N2448_03725 [Caloramator sp.]|nr:hypothetical protein [Caloramator sp.]